MIKKLLINYSVTLLFMSLTACSSIPFIQSDSSVTSQTTSSAYVDGNAQTVPLSPANAANAEAVGGNIRNSMDENDKTKLSRALDKALGKSTQWVNENTGVTYTVIPVRKITINGNPYCRSYTTIAEKNGTERQFNGTACVGTDSNWQEMN